jgi:hypothetical protein
MSPDNEQGLGPVDFILMLNVVEDLVNLDIVQSGCPKVFDLFEI